MVGILNLTKKLNIASFKPMDNPWGNRSGIKLLNNSTLPFSKQKNWNLTAYGKKDNIKLSSLVNTFIRMGKHSKYGSVERLSYNGNKHLYVMKTITFDNPNYENIFDTEVKVGRMKNIEKVGPRILAWRKLETKGQYIMDNAELGDSSSHIYTLHSFKNKLPQIKINQEKFWKLVDDNIKEFHKITHGDHGDLHGGNILVVYSKIRGLFIRIIDYGAFRTPSELLHAKKRPLKHFGIQVYNFNKGQPFIFNVNSLKNIKNSKVHSRSFKSNVNQKNSRNLISSRMFKSVL